MQAARRSPTTTTRPSSTWPALAAVACLLVLSGSIAHVSAAAARSLRGGPAARSAAEQSTRRRLIDTSDPATICTLNPEDPTALDWTYNPVCYGDGSYTVLAPADWHKNEEYAACAGPRQSPIDILTSTVEDLGCSSENEYLPAFSWQLQSGSCPFNQLVPSTKHALELSYEGCDDSTRPGLQYSGALGHSSYKLKQVHLHAGSEHSIDGQFGAAELHLVHINEADSTDILVLAVLLDVAETSEVPEVYKYWTLMNEAVANYQGESAIDMNAISDPYALLPESKQYYTYQGSLTIPPCTETVTFVILAERTQVADAQLQAFRQSQTIAFGPTLDQSGSNARPLQPLNGRSVATCSLE
eukprot:TRINITY_DN1744_c0_g1_i2.p1 TRINITY_DN1744_c0_g1~~TRINITY_DN1744_c0_g1_i2.p1  ORF type:complete len:357 (-),score=66.77 TRINITY_DN1744_c0_g1_i2:401-1471(-)